MRKIKIENLKEKKEKSLLLEKMIPRNQSILNWIEIEMTDMIKKKEGNIQDQDLDQEVDMVLEIDENIYENNLLVISV